LVSFRFQQIINKIREQIQDDREARCEEYGYEGMALGEIDDPIVQFFVQLPDFVLDE